MLEKKAEQRKVRTAHAQAEAGSDARLDPAWDPPPSAAKVLSRASSSSSHVLLRLPALTQPYSPTFHDSPLSWWCSAKSFFLTWRLEAGLLS